MGHRTGTGARALRPLAPQAFLTFVFTAVVSHASTNLLSNATYDVIGPFPLNVHVGGGEITASLGGVEAMRRNKSAYFPSELGDGGQVGWMEAKPDAASGIVSLDFPWYREEFLAEALGLGAIADTVSWAATDVCIPAGQYRVMCSGASAFWIGGQQFVGDVYGLPIWSGESAWLRWPARLPAGCHTLLVRTSQDFKCELEADGSGAKLYVQQEQQHSRFTPQLTLHLPDILDGRLASHLLSFPVVNAHSSATKAVSVAVRSAALCADVPAASRRSLASAQPQQPWTPQQLPQQQRFNASLPQSRRPASSLGAVMHGADRREAVYEEEEDAARAMMHGDVGLQRVCAPVPGVSASLAATVVLQPGQSVPLPVRLADRGTALQHRLQAAPCSSAGSGSLDVELEVQAGFEDGSSDTLLKAVSIACRPAGSAYTMTFLDADGSVQTAAVRAPQDCGRLPAGCPIVLATHGAGVDSSSPVWTSSLPAAPHAWTLFPTNRGRYGFDWQGVGKLNALAAVHALAAELPGVAPEQQPDMRVDSETVLFTGHSMGGHGCMVLSTHFPDKAVGAACAAGWIRYDHYVQEYQSPGTSFSDPFLQGLLKSAVADYETDVMASNLRGVPFLARMGGNDDNVNPWNLRRFVRVLKQVNAAGEAIDTQCDVSEVPGKPHWWGEVMNGAPMPDFFRARLAAGKPPLPRTFSVHAASPQMGGRGGVRVLQQRRGFRLSKVHVSIDESSGQWTLRTQNVRRLGISRTESQPPLHRLTVDGTDLPAALLPEQHLCWAEPDGAGAAAAWQACRGTTWMQRERSAVNCGPLAQAIEGPLLLVYSAQQPNTRPLAVGLANSLVARGRSLVRVASDEELLSQPAALLHERPNVVIIADPCSSPAPAWAIGNSSLALTTAVGCDSGASWLRLGDASPFSGDGIGYMLLGQLWPGPSAAPTAWKGRGSRGLVVVVGGSGDAGVAVAAHAFPWQAQAELPDYVVLGPDFAWQGQGGILTAGFWAHDWSIDATSRYP